MATSNRVRVVIALPFDIGDPFGDRFLNPDYVLNPNHVPDPPTFVEELMRVIGRGPGESITVSTLKEPRVQFKCHTHGDGTAVGTWRPAGTVSSAEIERAFAAVTILANTAAGQVGKEAGILMQLFRGGLRAGAFTAAIDVLEDGAMPPPDVLEALDTVRLILLAEQAE